MIQAQPNSSWIKFEVVKKWNSVDFPGKTEVQIKVLSSEVQTDERFIVPGELMEGFTFESHEMLDKDVVLIAEAEYIGGPGSGKVQLSSIKSENS